MKLRTKFYRALKKYGIPYSEAYTLAEELEKITLAHREPTKRRIPE